MAATSAPVLVRAYSLLKIKSVDGQTRTVTGIATSPTPDRMGDIVEPLGVKFTNPLPLLLYHNSQKPVGQVKFSKPTEAGIEFEAHLPTIDEPGVVKDRIDEAWHSLNANPPLIGGVSIGFRPIEESFMPDTCSWRYLQCEVLELSLVVIPANPDATIATVKSLDIGLAASGTRPAPPGVTGTPRTTRNTSRTMKKSYADQIATWEATRKTKTDRMDAILDASSERGTTLDAAEKEEHQTLEAEVKDIDDQLAVLKSAQTRAAASAQPARGTGLDVTGAGAGGRERATNQVHIEKKLPPGIGFARHAMCIMASKGHPSEAMELAKTFYPDDSMLFASLRLHRAIGAGNTQLLGDMRMKAAIGAGAADGSHWADDLVPYNILMNDFIEFLRPGSIVGKFGGPNPGGGGDYPALHKVPFNVRVTGASAGLTAHWVGEGLPAPLSKMTTFATSLTWAKVEAIAVLTNEEIRFSNPSAEAKVRDDIGRAVNARLDVDFVDPALAAVVNVSPASITNAVVATPPTGTTAAFVRTDLASLIGGFATANLDPSDIVLIMSASQALQLSMMVNTLGNADFPDISMKGGILRGFPVIVSQHLTSVGSPGTETIVAVKASDVYLADDGVVTVDASNEASLEMLDSSLLQSGVAGTGASLVSLWQNGLLGLRAIREITWKMRRTTAVGYISPAAYKA